MRTLVSCFLVLVLGCASLFGTYACNAETAGDLVPFPAGDAGSCKVDRTACGTECIDVSADPDHCGACGAACATDEVCAASRCTSTCADGRAACDHACVDTLSDEANCGMCSRSCKTGQTCVQGTCEVVCSPSQTVCRIYATAGPRDAGSDGGQSDGGVGEPIAYACASLATDRAHCGLCGNACVVGATCENGACVVPAATMPANVIASMTCDLGTEVWGTHPVAIDRTGVVHVAARCGGDLWIATSRNAFGSFEPPQRIAAINQKPYALAVGPEGFSYLAYVAAPSLLMFTRSIDRGASWSTPVQIGSGTTTTGIALAARGEYVYAAIPNTVLGDPRIQIARSNNRGASFSVADVALSNVGPFDLVVDPATEDVWIMSDSNGVYIKKSIDHGATFGLEVTFVSTLSYTDWGIGGGKVVLVGQGGPTANTLFFAPTNSPTTLTPVTSLATLGQDTRALSVDTQGNAYVASTIAGPRVVLDRAAPGATSIGAARNASPPSVPAAHPGVAAMGAGRGAVVVYDAAGSVYATSLTWN